MVPIFPFSVCVANCLLKATSRAKRYEVAKKPKSEFDNSSLSFLGVCMKKIRNFASALVCLSLSTAFAQTTIKVASVAPSRSSWDVEQRRIAKEWSEITNGQIVLQFMNADAMGGEAGVVKKLNSIRPGQKEIGRAHV